MKVVIVGGGFGGVRLALNLAKRKNYEVTLVSDKSYFEYHAALYRSATGRSPLEVAIPLAAFFGFAKNVSVEKARITKIDAKRRLVEAEDGSCFPYQQLVIAVGGVTEYFGIKGLAKYSYGVKTIQEALELKRHLHAELTNNQVERNYVVIGAGPTGVELAAELGAYIKRVRRRHKIERTFKVDLVEAGPRVLPQMPTHFSDKVKIRLKNLGVQVYLNTAVKAESVDEINLPGGHIHSQSVIWTAGVGNNPIFAHQPELFKLDSHGRVVVDGYLQAADGIYVIGDSAATKHSGMAQTAIYDANFVSGHFDFLARGKSPLPYKPKRPVYAIPVGARWAAVLWGKVEIYGFGGWMLRRSADLWLYLRFLTIRKALATWRYGFVAEEVCPVCQPKGSKRTRLSTIDKS